LSSKSGFCRHHDVFSRHGCLGHPGSAQVTFISPYGAYPYTEWYVGCLAVKAPGGVLLADLGWPLWHEVSRLTHLAPPSP
jgi:hypothetical protein